jgi:hypothetical protein
VIDPIRSRRGKNARKRGLAIQHDFARDLGLENLQGNGPIDARTDDLYASEAFVAQIKSGLRFPGWMANELAKLPRSGGRIPILGIAETPGPGRKRRRIVVVDADDWIGLHGGGGG